MVEASLAPSSVPSWESLRREFGEFGAPGLTIGKAHVAHRTRRGKLAGILILGDRGFVVRVGHGYRRRGLATWLLRVALSQWPTLDILRERYTSDGAAWMNAYLAKRGSRNV